MVLCNKLQVSKYSKIFKDIINLGKYLARVLDKSNFMHIKLLYADKYQKRQFLTVFTVVMSHYLRYPVFASQAKGKKQYLTELGQIFLSKSYI